MHSKFEKIVTAALQLYDIVLISNDWGYGQINNKKVSFSCAPVTVWCINKGVSVLQKNDHNHKPECGLKNADNNY